jgi:hypothetical protein
MILQAEHLIILVIFYFDLCQYSFYLLLVFHQKFLHLSHDDSQEKLCHILNRRVVDVLSFMVKYQEEP